MMIQSDEHFRQAVNQWRATATFQGTPFINAGERKIYDEIPDPTPELPGHVRYVDVTPTQAVLESALDTALAQQTQASIRQAARDTAQETLRGNRLDTVLQRIDDDIAEMDSDSALVDAATLGQLRTLLKNDIARQKRLAQQMRRAVQMLSRE